MSINPTGKVDNAAVEAEPLSRATPSDALGLASIATELHFRRRHFDLPSNFAVAPLVVEGVRELRVSQAGVAHPFRAANPASRTRVRGPSTCRAPAARSRHSVGGRRGRRSALDGRSAAGASARGRPRAREPRSCIPRPGSGPPSLQRTPDSVRASDSIAKALDVDTLIAWEMNGEEIPDVHGGPVRAIVPGYYGVDSVKWLERITVLESQFRGPFQRHDYCLFGELTTRARNSMLSRFTRSSSGPLSRTRSPRAPRDLRDRLGWPRRCRTRRGTNRQRSLERVDFERPTAWGRGFWRLEWQAVQGRHVIAVRATDATGIPQPEEPRRNRLGYANNSIQRRVVQVA